MKKRIKSSSVTNGKIQIINKKEVRFITAMLRSLTNVYLTGGAVIDIMDGVTPKDYDLYSTSPGEVKKKLEDAGCEWVKESDYSITYVKGVITIQLLKESDKSKLGEFSISRSMFHLNKGTLEIDEDSYINDALVPIGIKDVDKAMNCLSRIPHWNKKGYTLSDDLYFSLLNSVKSELDKGGFLSGILSKKKADDNNYYPYNS